MSDNGFVEGEDEGLEVEGFEYSFYGRKYFEAMDWGYECLIEK